MDLSLNVRRDGRGTTVEVGGEIDLCSGRRLFEFALDVMRERGARLAVDLTEVTFMDCGGVKVLLAIRGRARLLGGRLWVVSPSAPVRRILEITEMDAVLGTSTRHEDNSLGRTRAGSRRSPHDAPGRGRTPAPLVLPQAHGPAAPGHPN